MAYVHFAFFGGAFAGMKVLQEGAWGNLRRVGWGKAGGTDGRE